MFDRDVRLMVGNAETALLQLPKSHKDEAALQPHGRASRPAHESELIWGRAGGV